MREVIQGEDGWAAMFHLLCRLHGILQDGLRNASLASCFQIGLRAPAIHLPLDSALADGSLLAPDFDSEHHKATTLQ